MRRSLVSGSDVVGCIAFEIVGVGAVEVAPAWGSFVHIFVGLAAGSTAFFAASALYRRACGQDGLRAELDAPSRVSLPIMLGAVAVLGPIMLVVDPAVDRWWAVTPRRTGTTRSP